MSSETKQDTKAEQERHRPPAYLRTMSSRLDDPDSVHPEEDAHVRNNRIKSTDSILSADYPDEPVDITEVDRQSMNAESAPSVISMTSAEKKAAADKRGKHVSRNGSFTKAYAPYLAAPDSIMGPRGADSTRGASTFATRAHRTRVYRSWCSRVMYTFLLLNMIVWIPIWLKLLTIERNETQKGPFINIYNSSISIDLQVSTFDDPSTACGRCDEADDGVFGVTYPVRAVVDDFAKFEGVPTAAYVTLLASYDFDTWFVVNEPGDLTGLSAGFNDVEVCRADPIPLETDDDDASQQQQQEQDDADFQRTIAKQTQFEQYQQTTPDGEVITEYVSQLTRWTTFAPTAESEKETEAPTPLDLDDAFLSRCCLDKPGFVYLVACASPYEYLQRAEIYTKVEGPPFEAECMAITGRCGVSCGVDADAPIPDTCVNGEIPLDKLLDERALNPSDYDRRRLVGSDRRHYDSRLQWNSFRTKLYHASFVFFVMLMAVGTWISFFAGTGSLEEPLKPSMTEVEAYLADADSEAPKQTKKPVCLVAFSISAAEPRMMVLRNLCGKLMSWIHQRKFTLALRNVAKASVFDSDPRRTTMKALSVRELKAATLETHVECLDMFQDEGHRIGVYALWDAFVDLVHDADLRFIEAMANKMTSMNADDDRLIGKDVDDGMLLDDELRRLVDSEDYGITQDKIDKFELAFATYDLMTALGHHAFWRNDGKLDVVQFRDLASSPPARATLRLWADNFKKERKHNNNNPFAANVAPTTAPGIDQDTWNGWWELYNEMGRNQWVKRYDCTKFRLIRLHYDRAQNGPGHHRDLMMCYAARANPEDLRIQLAPTRMVRGIARGVFVRLKQSDTPDVARLFHSHDIKPLTRSEARRCHARVVSHVRLRGTSGKYEWHVKVKECTPELLTVLPQRYIVNAGVDEEELELGEGGEGHRPLLRTNTQGSLFGRNESSYMGEEAILPLKLIQPLRESRGKAGGMNHACEIINYYIRHHSTTMNVMKDNAKRNEAVFWSSSRNLSKKHRGGVKRGEVPRDRKSNPVAACLLFAIFDCRHMATQGFWDTVIPYFYAYKNIANPWSRQLTVDRPVAFVQLPQTFSSLTLDTDIFDMRNEYLFRLANNIRSGVGAITSCGTNAVWNYDIKFQESPLEHRFNEDTMIEDTASSHDVIIAGRKGVYHFERLVLGAKKGTNDYLAAVFRWSRGAVQLFWTTFYFPRYKYLWPYLVLVVHVSPIVLSVFYFQTVKLNDCHQTQLSDRLGLVPCHSGPVAGLISDPVFIIFAIIMITLAMGSFHWHRCGAYTVMFENVTYFFTSLSAFYWVAIPPMICIARNGVPPVLDSQLLTAGALWLQLHSALIIHIVRVWSPLENGTAPSDQSLLRSQQMYFLTAPLHALAILVGMRDGFQIIFRKKDASRWSSFDSVMALAAVKIWIILLVGILSIAIIWGFVNMFKYDDSNEDAGVRMLGIFFCVILLYLVETPARAMFFYRRVIKEKSKPSRLDRCTAAIFGKKAPIRPDYIYLGLWILLLIYSVRTRSTSDGVTNTRSRCSNNPDETGCDDVEYYKFVRVPGQGLVG